MQRVDATKRLRNNLKVWEDNYSFRVKRKIWDAFLIRREVKLDLANVLSNLERVFRAKAH